MKVKFTLCSMDAHDFRVPLLFASIVDVHEIPRRDAAHSNDNYDRHARTVMSTWQETKAEIAVV